MTKQYDRAYFDRWYRNRTTRVSSHAEVRRKVSLAVASAEYFLHRPIRSVLDVGCGEGAWLPHLRALRRGVRYLGFDSSEYVVERFGKSRNIHQATFGDLPSLDLGVHDLVVCSDVMHYVPDRELRAGINAIAEATDGVAYLEVLTKEDDIVGDLHGFLRRPAAFYRTLFTKAGMRAAGPYLWLSPAFADAVAELERS
ncbi:MAG TPA: methyltransferase domain-containing protein [Thermoanaerobaculia bacterium]|jgi:SAM-dependent methyltransferase|nr:methyltransferase domain-containing protein [Thermoanaerobaculia bacterium]